MAGTAPVPKPSTDVMAGEAFGKYVLMKRIAMGGMAEVSLARLQGTAGFNKLVVIKQVLPAFAETPQFVEMFLDEARLAARLSHPNIAQTFELGEEAGRHYIAMEYVPGESLYSILKRCRERGLMLPMGATLRVAMQLLEALDYAHQLTDESGSPLGLVHRDVTPSNVMVTQQGSIKLVDFGIARAATQLHHTEVGRVKGKGGYMAPEQCRGSNVDSRADIYGAGAVLYLMSTGMKPFEHLPAGTDLFGQMSATMEGSFKRPHEIKPDIHPELERIILKAMALKPDDRYQTSGAMLDDLEHFSGTAQVFPGPRELGEFVKKLFPKEAETGDLSREPSSSRATPMPESSLDAKLATQDPGSEADAAASTVLREDVELDSTAANAMGSLGPRASAPVKPWMIGAAGAVLVLVGIFISVRLFAREVVPPHVAAEAPRPKAAPAPVAVVTPAPAPVPVAAAAVVAEPTHEPEPVAAEPTQPEPAAVPEPEPAPAAVAPAATAAHEPAPTPAPTSPQKKRVAATVRRAATGTLQVNAYPWAKVRLKGRELGITPLKLDLPAGEYSLDLENPVLAVKRTVKLTVREGQETTHFEKLTP